MINNIRIDKAKGILLGLHVGDSLGASLEFCDPRDITDLQTDIIGGGPFDWDIGEATDDTQLMIMILESLVANEGKVNINDISDRFVKWMKSSPRDIGGTVREALSQISRGKSPFESGLRAEYSQGNGSLMRSAPLSILQVSKKDVEDQCSITHAHPNCIACDLIFNDALKNLIDGSDKLSVYMTALSQSKELSDDLYKILKRVPDLRWEDIHSSGYVVDTLAYAFWGLLATSTFEEALIKVVNRGGDADTLGAVCGSLCGAFYGVEGIPSRWLDVIKERNKIIELLNRLKNK